MASSIFRNAPSVFSPSVHFGTAGLPNDPASSAFAAAAAHNIFTSGFKAGDTLTQIQAALSPIAFSAPGYYSPPNDFVAPKTTEWSVELERSLDPHDVLALTYTGNHGYDQAISNTSANFFLLLASNGLNKYYGTSFGGLPTAAPDPRFLTVTQVLTQGYSNYDAMTLQLRHSMRWGFQGQFGWTWSHGLGLASVYNPYNLNFGYGNESIDVAPCRRQRPGMGRAAQILQRHSPGGAGRLESRHEGLRLYRTAVLVVRQQDVRADQLGRRQQPDIPGHGR